MSRQPVPKLSKPGVGAVLQKSFRLLRGHAQHFFVVAAALIFPLTLISSLIHTPTFNSIVNDSPGLIFSLVPANTSLAIIKNSGGLQHSLLDFPTHFQQHSKHLLQVDSKEEDSLLGIKVKDGRDQQSGVLEYLRGFFHGIGDRSKNLTLPDAVANFSSSSEASVKLQEAPVKVSSSSQQSDGGITKGESALSTEDDEQMLANFSPEQLLRMVVLVICDLGSWILLKCVSEAAVTISVAGSYLGTLAGLAGQPRKVFFTKDYFRSLWHAAGRVFITVLALGSLFMILYVIFVTAVAIEYFVLMVLLNVPALTFILMAMTTMFFLIIAIHVLIVTTLSPGVSVLEGKCGWTALSRSAYLIRSSRRFSTAFLLKIILTVVQYLLLGLGINALVFGFIDFIARLLMGHKSLEEFARSEGVVKIPWMVIDYDILFNNTVASAVILFTIVVNNVLLFFCKTGCGENLGEHVTFGSNRELTDLIRDASVPTRPHGMNIAPSSGDTLLDFVSTHGLRHGNHGS